MPADPPPTFSWTRQNNSANDTFGLILWDPTVSARLLDIAISGDVTTYTLSPAEWATLTATAVASGGSYAVEFVVTGRDGLDPLGVAYPAADVSGDYWSGRYQFTVIPEPLGGTRLALFGTLLLLNRRRQRLG